ncbi:MAG: hypothetical protein JXN62_07400, partial [Bacteroidales bacterium]|nr:hypothetical protein [Bacteroidales bacterium]
MQGAKKRDGIYIVRRMSLSLLIIILIVSTLILVPVSAVCLCKGLPGCSCDTSSSSGGSGCGDSCSPSSGGMTDATTGGKTSGRTISPGEYVSIGNGISFRISGDEKTIVTFTLLDGFKVKKIVATEKLQTGTDSDATEKSAKELATDILKQLGFNVEGWDKYVSSDLNQNEGADNKEKSLNIELNNNDGSEKSAKELATDILKQLGYQPEKWIVNDVSSDSGQKEDSDGSDGSLGPQAPGGDWYNVDNSGRVGSSTPVTGWALDDTDSGTGVPNSQQNTEGYQVTQDSEIGQWQGTTITDSWAALWSITNSQNPDTKTGTTGKVTSVNKDGTKVVTETKIDEKTGLAVTTATSYDEKGNKIGTTEKTTIYDNAFGMGKMD